MPLYEFESPSGEVYLDLFPAGECPSFIYKTENGKKVKCRKLVSNIYIPSSINERREQEISGDRDEQEAIFFKPDKRNGYNPKTKRPYSDAELVAAGDPKVRTSKGTKRLLDKKLNELRGAV